MMNAGKEAKCREPDYQNALWMIFDVYIKLFTERLDCFLSKIGLREIERFDTS